MKCKYGNIRYFGRIKNGRQMFKIPEAKLTGCIMVVILMKAKTIKISDISKWLDNYEHKFYEENIDCWPEGSPGREINEHTLSYVKTQFFNMINDLTNKESEDKNV